MTRIALVLVLAALAQAAPYQTTVQDLIYRSDGQPFNGTVEISWPRFVAQDGSVVSPGVRRIRVQYGFLRLTLVPYSAYAVRYLVGETEVGTETWNVPLSVTPVKVVQVRPGTDPPPHPPGGDPPPAPTAGFVDQETPGGAVNGTNAVFTLTRAPAPVSSLMLTRNGLVQKRDLDYSITGGTITFLPGAVPQAGDALMAWYRY